MASGEGPTGAGGPEDPSQGREQPGGRLREYGGGGKRWRQTPGHGSLKTPFGGSLGMGSLRESSKYHPSPFPDDY